MQSRVESKESRAKSRRSRHPPPRELRQDLAPFGRQVQGRSGICDHELATSRAESLSQHKRRPPTRVDGPVYNSCYRDAARAIAHLARFLMVHHCCSAAPEFDASTGVRSRAAAPRQMCLCDSGSSSCPLSRRMPKQERALTSARRSGKRLTTTPAPFLWI